MSGIHQGAKVVELRDGGRRRFRSKQEHRAIVEESLKPGASVSLVARAHDVKEPGIQMAQAVPRRTLTNFGPNATHYFR